MSMPVRRRQRNRKDESGCTHPGVAFSPIRMRAYCLMHRVTGQILPGYRVNAAADGEIAKANSNLRCSGSDYRLVIDVHSSADDLPQQGFDATPA